jgi:Protein of unknown function (DUF2971)
VARAMLRLASADNLDANEIARAMQIFNRYESTFDGLAFCLSAEGDLLSQWRGYAIDATGLSIGFSSEYFAWLGDALLNSESGSFRLLKVEYEEGAHDETVAPTYAVVKECIRRGALREPMGMAAMLLDSRTEAEIEADRTASSSAYAELNRSLVPLVGELFRLKDKAFAEEKEWRLLTYSLQEGGEGNVYTPANNRLIPHREFGFLEIGKAPIAEVVLGPKHGSPIAFVADFLKQSGYGDVKVRRSAASYR